MCRCMLMCKRASEPSLKIYTLASQIGIQKLLIERVLEMERGLKRLLQNALGMDNIVELAVQWFDADGDGGLNREEYFTLSQTIQLDQMRKDAKAQYPDEYRNPEKNRALKDEF